MAYKIIVSPRVQKEIENAIDYYALYSSEAPSNFIKALKDCYDSLENNPYFRVRYKNIRSVKLKRFPYSLFFTITEEHKTIRVLSCFHNKRDPNKRP
jgi:plasmid stabilization system protein ParE